MKYPSKSKNKYQNNITYSNRGLGLETLINQTNQYYIDCDIAIIYKKPTDIGIVKVNYKENAKIENAYFKSPSTLDYNGIYKGKYIEFDAKETKNKTSFPLSNIAKHQYKHLNSIIKHGGICFLIISMNNLIYLLPGEKLIEFINNNERKSIPYEYIEKNAYLIKYGYNPVIDYIKIIDKILREV